MVHARAPVVQPSRVGVAPLDRTSRDSPFGHSELAHSHDAGRQMLAVTPVMPQREQQVSTRRAPEQNGVARSPMRATRSSRSSHGQQLRWGQRARGGRPCSAYRCSLLPTPCSKGHARSGCSPVAGVGELCSVRSDTGRLLPQVESVRPPHHVRKDRSGDAAGGSPYLG